MKTITIVLLILFTPHALSLAPDQDTDLDGKVFTVDQTQARVNKFKYFTDNIEREINEQVFAHTKPSNSKSKEFRKTLTLLLGHNLVRGERFNALGISDIYICTAGVCGYLNPTEIRELGLLFKRADISQNLNDVNQTIPEALLPMVSNQARTLTHWRRVRALLRIAVKNAR